MRSCDIPAAIVLAGALSAAVAQSPTPHPNSIAAQLAGRWHHVPDSVSSDRAARDQAKCRMIAGPTPEINDIKFSVVLINCLRAEGYEPRAAPNVELHSFASTRFDDYSCADISKLKKKSANADLLFFACARGFIGGWNASAEKAILKVDPTVIDPDEQLKFIRAFCEANPSKLYMAGVIELLQNSNTKRPVALVKSKNRIGNVASWRAIDKPRDAKSEIMSSIARS